MTTETTATYIIEPSQYVGPFETEREALYYYGFANGTHQNHREKMSDYTADELERSMADPGYEGRDKLVSPSLAIRQQVANLFALEERNAR